MAENENVMTYRCYNRKDKFYISGIDTSMQVDVALPIGFIEFYVDNNTLISSIDSTNNKESYYWINEKHMYGGETTLAYGDMLYVGEFIITFYEDYIRIDGFNEKNIDKVNITLDEVEPEQLPFEGYPYYKRSPRIIYRLPDKKIEVSQPPQKKEMRKGGLVDLIVPVLSTAAFTVLMGLVMKRGAYVYMSLGMTIITLIFSVKRFIEDRRDTNEQNKERAISYNEYLLKMRKRIREERREEKEAYEYICPSLEDIGNMIDNGSSRLYERTIMDDDFLMLTVGHYSGRTKLDIAYGGNEEISIEKDPFVKEAKQIVSDNRVVDYVPQVISLKNAHIGLVGSISNVHEQLKNIIHQLTFFQSYHDIEIVFIHDEKYKSEFDYVRWYPHFKISSINVSGEIFSEGGKETLNTLQRIIKDRKLVLEEKKQEQVHKPHFIFIIDEPKMIINHPIMEYLQKDRINLGFSIIYTTDNEANLPENIHTVFILENSEYGRLLINEGYRVNRKVELEHYTPNGIKDYEYYARKLSAIIHEEGISSRIPESVTFFDLFKVSRPEEFKSEERWKKNQSHKTLAVPLGLRAEDDIVNLNLHEKAHGPHGLVAGTTGSGKSEIVQSYILSLALNFHPYEVGFLLIDYKGGGMANLFRDLPHLLGTITNLEKAESLRAMASIHSELLRRQQIFSDAGVNHINGYNKLFKEGKVAEPLPHLFMISDEFAELKSEQPDFMAELISTARIGRSLGIHLILATQKPSGVVDDQIWSNSKFKLCLKVADEGDSKEMLKTPDAASITQPGRAYLQVGNNEIYELFQSAWSGAEYVKDKQVEKKEDDRVYLLNDRGQGVLLNQDLSVGEKTVKSEEEETQLSATVKYLNQLYSNMKKTAIESGREFAEVKKPWLPSLGTNITSPYISIDRIVDSASITESDYTISVGIVDIPEEQKQEEYAIDFVKDGHLVYMASSGYGKSMIVTQVILGLAVKNSVKAFKSYVMDFGNSALIPLRGLPHVADYMGLDDIEKIQKFMRIISDEISDRKKKFAKAMAQNIYVYNETSEEKLGIIVIAVDNYDAVREIDDDLESFMQRVSRDGAGLGIYIVATISRESAMRSATMNNFKQKICGYNFDESESRTFLGRTELTLPEDKKGRAFVKLENVNIMQVYTPVDSENEIVYIENLKKIIGRIKELSTEKKAKGIPMLPEDLFIDDLPEYPGYVQLDENRIPVAIETEELSIVSLDISKGIGLIVGESESGKTTMLTNILNHILPYNRRIFVFDNSSMSLASYKQNDLVTYDSFESPNIDSMFDEIQKLINERKELYEEAKIDNPLITPVEFAQTLEKVYVVIDVIQNYIEKYKDEDRTEVLDVLMDAIQWNISCIVASDVRIPLRGGRFAGKLSEAKSGIVLGSISNQQIFDISRVRDNGGDNRFGYYIDNNKAIRIMVANKR